MSDDLLWTHADLLAALGARAQGGAPIGARGVSIDTRTLAPGDLFVALRGEKSDGHDYLPQAFAKGAAACVIEEARLGAMAAGGPLYVVKDAQTALEGLGRAARQRARARIAAITGSVGKTSTKEALRLILSAFGPTHAAVASYNNHLGVPLTLARMPPAAAYGVFEVGMNHAGEIRPLATMVRPHVAIITSIAPVHLENLGSLMAIADEKSEIYAGLEPGGVAILNADAPYAERLMAAARRCADERVRTFGEGDADMRLVAYEEDAAGATVGASFEGRTLRYRIGAPGRHLAMNSLAVLLAAHAMGCDLDAAARGLAAFAAPSGRGARIRLPVAGGDYLLIDEAYNANPASMRAALAALGGAPVGPGGRRIAVLGDMLELGPDAARMHAELSEAVAAARVDLVFSAGPLMNALHEALPPETRGLWTPTSTGLENVLAGEIRAGDVVMIKGSNGSRMGPVVAALQKLAAARPADEVPPC